jgi:lipopolysaccharide biosynthesis regulator YciM
MSNKFKLQSNQTSNDYKLMTNQLSKEKSFEKTKKNDNPNNQISISNNDLIVINNLIKSSIEKSNQEYKSKKNQKSSKKLDWTCPVCQNLNYSFRDNCNLCSYIKN